MMIPIPIPITVVSDYYGASNRGKQIINGMLTDILLPLYFYAGIG